MSLLTPELQRCKGVGQPMFSRVKKRQEYCVEIDSIYDDKILKKVAANPKLGAKRLS